MKNKILKSIFLVLIIAVIVLLTIFIRSKLLLNQKTQSPTQIAFQPTTTSIELSGWKTYRNEKYGFEFKYPKESEILKETEKEDYISVSIRLPFNEGTVLREKKLIIIAKKATWKECSNLLEVYPLNITKGKTVYINNIKFKQEKGFECAMNQCYYFTSYLTTRGDQCFSLNFVFTIANPEVFEFPPPNFDPTEESKVFNKILSTFKFLKTAPQNVTF